MIEANHTNLRPARRIPGGSTAQAAWQRSAQALGIGAALVASIAIAPRAVAQQIADSIWSGGPILTMNDKAMRAEAVAVPTARFLPWASAARS